MPNQKHWRICDLCQRKSDRIVLVLMLHEEQPLKKTAHISVRLCASCAASPGPTSRVGQWLWRRLCDEDSWGCLV
jgi:hypothetical protein